MSCKKNHGRATQRRLSHCAAPYHWEKTNNILLSSTSCVVQKELLSATVHWRSSTSRAPWSLCHVEGVGSREQRSTSTSGREGVESLANVRVTASLFSLGRKLLANKKTAQTH